MSTVAVIIAAYNAAGCLDGALASVAAQTVAPAEVVVADDCSEDDTAAVACRWDDRLPMTVVRTASNAGPGVARDVAVTASRSPMLALLDADDVWLPDHLETMLGAVRGPDDLVMADRQFWVPGEGVGVTWSELLPAPRSDQLSALYRRNFVNSSTMFSRQLYVRAGGFRPPMRVGEDWNLWIRMVRAGAALTVTDHPTVRYRMKPERDAAFGDRMLVLELARSEALSDGEARSIRSTMRALRAEGELFEAYRVAMHSPWSARWHGVRSLGGHRRVALRGAAMALAPRQVAARRARMWSDPRNRLRG